MNFYKESGYGHLNVLINHKRLAQILEGGSVPGERLEIRHREIFKLDYLITFFRERNFVCQKRLNLPVSQLSINKAPGPHYKGISFNLEFYI